MSEQGTAANRGNILIVDDTLANLRLLTEMLREQGYRVRGAPNGEIALNAARSSLPDILLLDINMPGMNGYEVCREMKSDERTSDLPVIFLSALDEALDKVKAFQVGGVDYITKPFQLEEVLARIENQLKMQRLQEELREAREEAERANRAKSLFLANMSHEIRTPMNAILGYAQILVDDEEMTAKQRKGVETIRTSGEHLLALINDVLDLSKIEAGREELHPSDFDLQKLVQALSIMFRMRCEQKGLGWRIEDDLSATPVHGDEKKLRQVLINLLGNAAKFTEEGEVVLKVSTCGEHRYRFEVADTGPGIPTDRQATIFEPFHQEKKGWEKGGTGLGLAIARRYVALMDGQLEIESAAGTGTSFSFSLTMHPATGTEGTGTEENWNRITRLVPEKEVRALLVDDLETDRDILAQLLKRIGVEVRQAASGAQALKQLNEEMPDVVFLDIRMPEMDGPQVLEKICAEYGREGVKVIAVSASVLDHQRHSYLEAGFDRFIAKPFRPEEIYTCLAELLGVRFEYAPPEASTAVETSTIEPSDVVLPESLWKNLHDAVKIHNISALNQHLDKVNALGTAGEQLTALLRQLNQQYDMKAIAAVLDEVRHE